MSQKSNVNQCLYKLMIHLLVCLVQETVSLSLLNVLSEINRKTSKIQPLNPQCYWPKWGHCVTDEKHSSLRREKQPHGLFI